MLRSRLPLKTPPKSVCILRLSALGDVTHILPVVRRLQAAWPQTKLTWIIGKFELKLVHDLPGVELIPFDKRGGFSAFKHLRAILAKRRFDVLLHMQLAFRANLVASQIKADCRIGYDRTRAKDLHGLFLTHRIPHQTNSHVVTCFQSFLDTLGTPESPLTWDVPIPQEAHDFAAQQLHPQRPNLLISPCSSHSLRNWSAQAYADVADYAVKQHNLFVVLCGGPTDFERQMGTEIETHMSSQAHNLIGKDTIKRLLAMIARADLMISPDSGPGHMATAVGTPVIGLYAATDVNRSGPYLSRQWCVDKYDEAARQFKGKPGQSLKWGAKLEIPGVMDLIKPADVKAKIDALMAARKK